MVCFCRSFLRATVIGVVPVKAVAICFKEFDEEIVFIFVIFLRFHFANNALCIFKNALKLNLFNDIVKIF